ncbi:methionyl-tRNA formyltransferase [Azospirillum sp.]|uniref:methionyl-tRNA formyltransferase n=1 Tax=Azospirillum sp. TaxID=34012 RepID=UPI002D4034DA|nr:formyltransferase family protein [Azospirillum sp.]HYD68789.1 formyltransferase family protein [Azospirillum sp.]
MPLTLFLAVEEAAGLQLLQALLRTPHRIAGVAVTPGDPAGVERLALRHGLAVWPASLVKDPAFADTIRAAGVDLLLNVHSLHVVCPQVLEAPRLGAYNLHPGPLPHYAGLNAPSWAIFNGETRHAVTLHRMVPAIDAGPVAAEEAFPIGPDDTALSVYTRCAKFGLLLVARLVDRYAEDPASVHHRNLDPAGRRVYGRKPPNGGWIDWDWPADTIANFARACAFGPFASPWGSPKLLLGDDMMAVTRLRRGDRPADAPPGTVVALNADGSALVAARGGTLLLNQLLVDGRRHPAAGILAAGCRFAGASDFAETRRVA